jgi:hypothetical protein
MRREARKHYERLEAAQESGASSSGSGA